MRLIFERAIQKFIRNKKKIKKQIKILKKGLAYMIGISKDMDILLSKGAFTLEKTSEKMNAGSLVCIM